MPGKYALIIGNTEYTDSGLAKLNTPGKDAEDFARVLKSPDIAAFDEVATFVNENVSNLNEAIEVFFAGKKPDDLLMFYFSGHGVRDESGALFLAVKNTNRSRLRSTAIKADFVRELMDQSRSKRQVIILDCCNSGAFAQGTKAETGGAMGIATTFKGTGYGRVVLTATDSTQFAWEGDKIIGDEITNSLFTHFLVKGLEGAADEDGDGKITVDELYDYAYEQIVSRTPKQTPGKWSYKQQGEIVLQQSTGIKNIKPIPLPADLIAATENTIPFVREGAVKQLESLLKGKNLGLARSAKEALERMAKEDDSRSIAQLAAHALISVEQFETPSAEDGNVKKNFEDAEKIRAETGRKNFLSKLKIPALILMIALVIYPIWQGLASLIAVSPAGTLIPQATFTIVPPTETLISTPALGIGSTMAGTDRATLMYVPEGKFTMGSNADDALTECKKFGTGCQRDWFINEEPPHSVYLDAFWIDKTEVTNALYAKCVSAGGCKEPANTSSETHSYYYGNPEFDNYPVIYVDWHMASAYCSWAGRRLPTEAEWEKAARGENASIYPWGNTFDGKAVHFCDINCSYSWANKSFNDGYADVAPVGNYPAGQSVYGALDLAGNVWEWVNDWYAVYPGSSVSIPDTFAQTYRILRGGSWYYSDTNARSAYRLSNSPDNTYNNAGFRCAYSLPK